MGQTFTVNGREMTLEQAQKHYSEVRKPKQEVVAPTIEEVIVKDDIDSLKKELDDLGVKYHWNAGADKLQSLLDKSKNNLK